MGPESLPDAEICPQNPLFAVRDLLALVLQW